MTLFVIMLLVAFIIAVMNEKPHQPFTTCLPTVESLQRESARLAAIRRRDAEKRGLLPITKAEADRLNLSPALRAMLGVPSE